MTLRFFDIKIQEIKKEEERWILQGTKLQIKIDLKSTNINIYIHITYHPSFLFKYHSCIFLAFLQDFTKIGKLDICPFLIQKNSKSRKLNKKKRIEKIHIKYDKTIKMIKMTSSTQFIKLIYLYKLIFDLILEVRYWHWKTFQIFDIVLNQISDSKMILFQSLFCWFPVDL